MGAYGIGHSHPAHTLRPIPGFDAAYDLPIPPQRPLTSTPSATPTATPSATSSQAAASATGSASCATGTADVCDADDATTETVFRIYTAGLPLLPASALTGGGGSACSQSLAIAPTSANSDRNSNSNSISHLSPSSSVSSGMSSGASPAAPLPLQSTPPLPLPLPSTLLVFVHGVSCAASSFAALAQTLDRLLPPQLQPLANARAHAAALAAHATAPAADVAVAAATSMSAQRQQQLHPQRTGGFAASVRPLVPMFNANPSTSETETSASASSSRAGTNADVNAGAGVGVGVVGSARSGFLKRPAPLTSFRAGFTVMPPVPHSSSADGHGRAAIGDKHQPGAPEHARAYGPPAPGSTQGFTPGLGRTSQSSQSSQLSESNSAALPPPWARFSTLAPSAAAAAAAAGYATATAFAASQK